MVRRKDRRPRYEQIAADLRARIIARELPPDSQLPSNPQLVKQYNASNPTIQNVVEKLKEEGFLYSHQGKGVYVRRRQPFVVEAAPYFTPSPDGFSYEILEVAEVRPPADVVEALELGEDGTAILRRRLMCHRGDPVEVDHSYYPSAIAAGSPLAASGRIKGGAPKALAELGFPQRHFVDTIGVRMPTTEEVELLDLPEVPVIRQFRVIYSDNDRPVEANVMIKAGHLYEVLYRKSIP